MTTAHWAAAAAIVVFLARSPTVARSLLPWLYQLGRLVVRVLDGSGVKRGEFIAAGRTGRTEQEQR